MSNDDTQSEARLAAGKLLGAGVSASSLADRAGCSRAAFTQWLAGGRTAPTTADKCTLAVTQIYTRMTAPSPVSNHGSILIPIEDTQPKAKHAKLILGQKE